MPDLALKKNILAEPEHTYDQIYKDENVIKVEKELAVLDSSKRIEFIDKLMQEQTANESAWFTRLIEFLEIVVPLKKEKDRSISMETKKNLMKIIFDIFDSSKDYINTLTSVFPLYKFTLIEGRTTYFRTQAKAEDNTRFHILTPWRDKPGYPSRAFTVLIHEFQHSRNASTPNFLINEMDVVKYDSYKRFLYSPYITFMKEYLSDLSAMSLTNKQNSDTFTEESIRNRILKRIQNDISAYKSLNNYVTKHGWEELLELSKMVPENLLLSSEISNSINNIIMKSLADLKAIPEIGNQFALDSENEIILKNLKEYLLTLVVEKKVIDNKKSEDLTDEQAYIKRYGDINNTTFYAEGAEDILTALRKAS